MRTSLTFTYGYPIMDKRRYGFKEFTMIAAKNLLMLAVVLMLGYASDRGDHSMLSDKDLALLAKPMVYQLAGAIDSEAMDYMVSNFH